jgi:hypothetical protein
MHETLPLSQIHVAVLEFLEGRDDVVLFGAQAVNAYVDEPRMTQDVDLISTRAKDLAEELRKNLGEAFHIATRVCEIKNGIGYRIYQVRSEGNRHLVDVRSVEALPNAERVENILVLSPLELIVSKVISYHSRRGKPKSGTDWRDLAFLLLRFPELKARVGELLVARNESEAMIATWHELAGQELRAEDDDDDLNY